MPLFEYGIHKESSTHHIHVDTKYKKVHVFKTSEGIKRLPNPIESVKPDEWEANGYRLIYPLWANGHPTARGINIKPDCIFGCVSVDIPEDITASTDFGISETSKKGEEAVYIVSAMLNKGLLPIQMSITVVDNKLDQINGLDIESEPIKIQVKYDHMCTKKGIFLQTHESNPKGWH